MAIALGIMSILVLWCEFAIPLPWDLSLFGLMIGSGGASVSQVVCAGVHTRELRQCTGSHWLCAQLLCFVPFAYMSWCMYLALFRVKLLNAISLTAGRLTNAYACPWPCMLATAHADLTATWWLSFRYTLMFNASYLCRLQFVLAYNYLLMIKTDALSGHKTAFEKYVLRAPLWHRRDVALC